MTMIMRPMFTSVDINDDLPTRIWQSEQSWLEMLCMKKHLDPTRLRDWLVRFCDELQCDGEETKDLQDFKHHFNRWLGIQMQKEGRITNSNNNYNGMDRQFASRKQSDREHYREQRQRDSLERLARFAGGVNETAVSDTDSFGECCKPEDAAYPFI